MADPWIRSGHAAAGWWARCPYCPVEQWHNIETEVLRTMLKHIVDNHMEAELRAAAALLRMARRGN